MPGVRGRSPRCFDFANAGTLKDAVSANAAAPAERVRRRATMYDKGQPFLSLAPTGLAAGLALKESRYAEISTIRPRDTSVPVGSPFPGRHVVARTRLGMSARQATAIAGFMSCQRLCRLVAGPLRRASTDRP